MKIQAQRVLANQIADRRGDVAVVTSPPALGEDAQRVLAVREDMNVHRVSEGGVLNSALQP